MPCAHIKLPNGMAAIVCTSGKRGGSRLCRTCDRQSDFLCDWKIGDGQTCDQPCCSQHALQVADDKHLCPRHQKAYREWQARRPQRDIFQGGTK
jgi:hypothetical protein